MGYIITWYKDIEHLYIDFIERVLKLSLYFLLLHHLITIAVSNLVVYSRYTRYYNVWLIWTWWLFFYPFHLISYSKDVHFHLCLCKTSILSIYERKFLTKISTEKILCKKNVINMIEFKYCMWIAFYSILFKVALVYGIYK